MNRSEKTRKGEEFLSQWFLAFLGYNNLENSVPSQKRAFHFHHCLRSFNSFDFTGPQNVIVWGVSRRALCLFMGLPGPAHDLRLFCPEGPQAGSRSPCRCPGPR